MSLDDAQVERYSRQIVLQEIGPRGQARLLASRVAISATGAAAERAAAYLAAAGVGTLALPPVLHACVEPAHPDVRVEPLLPTVTGRSKPAPDASPFDAALVDATDDGAPHARRTFWVADGRAAELPPCLTCVATALGAAPAVGDMLVPLRDAVLGTVVATEITKALLDIGNPLAGHVLTYDAETATVTTTPVAPRPTCPRCAQAMAG